MFWYPYEYDECECEDNGVYVEDWMSDQDE